MKSKSTWLRPRSILLLAVLLMLGVFATLNWSTLEEPALLDFLLIELEVPLGVLLLLVVAFLTLLLLAMVAQMEASARGERKRLLADVESWRKLADDAEASRITALREVMEAGFDDLYDRISVLTGTPGSPRRERPVELEGPISTDPPSPPDAEPSTAQTPDTRPPRPELG